MGASAAQRALVTPQVGSGMEIDQPQTFGALLKRHRLAAGLSQEQLAERASVLHAESLTLPRSRGDVRGITQSLSALAQIALQQRDLPEARRLLADAMSMLGDQDAPWPRAMVLTLLGHVELAAGDVGRAETLLAGGLRIFVAIDNRLYVPWSLDGLAGLALARGQPERAARLIGAGEAVRRWLGSPLPPVDPAGYADNVAATRAALGDTVFASAQEDGRALTFEDAVAAALVPPPDEP